MAKNKKKPQPQLLSPEKYIRQKARNLSIYECLINDDWKKMGSANVVIARIHTNGNLTVGAYLVDLLCMGVKDTVYQFNISQEDYREFLDMMTADMEMQKVEYSLVHNVIFAANEFAAEFGFKPPKDFTSVARYLLEEDTDDIELIEIECGQEGKPMFIQTDFYTEAESKRIINHLEKTVGKGNYSVIIGEDGDEMDDEDDEDDETKNIESEEYRKLVDEYDTMEYDDKVQLFRELTAKNINDIPDDDKIRLNALTESLYSAICDKDEVEKLCKSWKAELEIPLDDEEYTAELLGREPERIITDEEEIELDELYMLINDKPKKVEKYLKQLRMKWGNIPYLKYQELKYLEIHRLKEYKKKLNEYYAEFSDYPLLKIEAHKNELLMNSMAGEMRLLEFEEVFQERKSITELEMFEFQMLKIFTLLARGNMIEYQAVQTILDNLEINDEYYTYLSAILTIARINTVKEYLG